MTTDEKVAAQAKKELEELEGEDQGKGSPEKDSPSGPSPASVETAREALTSVGVSVADLTPEEAVEKAERVRAARSRSVQVLNRGRTLDSIDTALALVPDHLHGEFVRENDGDINRKRALGFELFAHPDAKKHSEHGAGDNRVRIGDVVLMVIPKEEYAAIQAVRAERRQKRKDAHKPTKQQIESTGLQTFGGNA